MRQVPLRTRVKLPHSSQASPSKPNIRASRIRSSFALTLSVATAAPTATASAGPVPVRTWAALAWADGVIAAAESVAIKRVIELAEFSEEDAATAHAYLDTKVELDTEGLEELSSSSREGIYKAAVRLAHVDLDLATEELTLLERLRQALDIESARARELEVEVERP